MSKLTKEQTIQALCELVTEVGGKKFNHTLPHDCFCKGESPHYDYVDSEIIEFIKSCVKKGLETTSFKDDLNITLSAYKEMLDIIKHCEEVDNPEEEDVWKDVWTHFWNAANKVPFSISYHDPDSSYEEDMRCKFESIKEFLELHDML